ncbi:MAG: hypothetical protein HC904_06455 [Blastochloris sp.]|nr:hypothetical protein [Blastochloris sp.]
MNLFSKLLLICLLSLVLISSAWSQTGTFRFVELAPLPGDISSAALSINHKDQIVGYSANADGRRQAVLWVLDATSSVLTPSLILSDLGGGYSEAYDINDLGEVVGQSTTASGQAHACLWNRFGVVSDLHILFKAKSATALALNNTQDIVGYQLNASLQPKALVIRKGRLEKWPETSLRRATAITDLSHVVGNGQTSATDTAYSATASRALALRTLPGYPFAEVQASNIFGEKAGSCSSDDKQQAVLWKGDRINPVSLGTLGGNYSKTLGMNQFQSIVGIAQVSNNTPVTSSTSTNNTGMVASNAAPVFNELDRAFWWFSGRMFDLNKMTVPPANWTLQAATAVNDFRQIVGYGNSSGQLRGFLLTPKRAYSLAITGLFSKTGAYYSNAEPVQIWFHASKKTKDIQVKIDGILHSTYTEIPYPITLQNIPVGYHVIQILAKDPNSTLIASWNHNFTVYDAGTSTETPVLLKAYTTK